MEENEMIMKAVDAAKVPVIDLIATGRNITKLRKKAGISVRDLQTIMGFTNPQAIYKWQKGCSLPSIDNLIILAYVLDTTVDDILVCDDDDSSEEVQNHKSRFIQHLLARLSATLRQMVWQSI